ncbi:MAG: hypothetical protein ABS36_14970 [Acidobacteria bacterium SCN 69-37]|nr:MAG: hypothetical protein ABS36_14970 [Acidobacteria bacterium SCN 69-37]
MQKKLTARDVETLQPEPGKRVEVFDTVIKGLALRITESGHKSWSVHYRVDGKLRRHTIGTVDKFSLAKAREKAYEASRDAATTGTDAGAEKRAKRQQATQGETVADLVKTYLEKHAKRHKRSWKDDDRMFNAEVLPKWRHRKAKDITRRDVRTLIEAIADRGSPITANRCLALVRKMLNFGIQQDWIDANPAALLKKPGVEASRDRVLTDDEVRLVWKATDAERPAMRALVRLRLITAQRGGELVAIRWSDISGDWLTLPPTITKNKTEHRVWLSDLAHEALALVPRVVDDEGNVDERVFPARIGKGTMTDLKQAGRRIAKHVLAALQKTDPKVEAFDFRAHDLRRTAATKMAEAGVDPTHISLVLNHVDGRPRATKIYDRFNYDPQKQAALATWARRLRAILDEKPADNVVPMTRKGA